MWVIDDESRSLLANTGDLAYMGEPLIIATASFIVDVGRGPVFKYPFDGGKYMLLAECFEKNKILHFLLFSWYRFNSFQCFANQLFEGTVVLM